jgi:hypothetical protein
MPATRLSRRIALRLAQAEACEYDPHCRDDLRIARLTVIHAARGDAVLCSPHVLATYEVLGLHPDHVWPAILARRQALGIPEEFWGVELPPKKPPQAVGRSQQKLWFEKASGAGVEGSRAAIQERFSANPVELMGSTAAVRPTAALYRNPDERHSGKSGYSLAEVLAIVDGSGAPHSVRALTISALLARGEWPREDGPVTNVLSVAILGMMLEDNCCRSTVQRRIRRAMKDNYWRRVRDANSWSNCPKCGRSRKVAKCECGYRGRSKDDKGDWTGEFMRVPVYEFDIQKFRSAQRCREIRHLEARNYAEYKATESPERRAEVKEWPRKPSQPAPPNDLPPATAAPKKPAAEHHRSTERRPRELTSRERAKLIQTITELRRGVEGKKQVDGYFVKFAPDDPRYVPPHSLKDAIAEACKLLLIPIETATEALKLAGFQLQE